jgi:hypothetical protein
MLIFAGIQFFQQPKDSIGSTTMKEYRTGTKRAYSTPHIQAIETQCR